MKLNSLGTFRSQNPLSGDVNIYMVMQRDSNGLPSRMVLIGIAKHDHSLCAKG